MQHNSHSVQFKNAILHYDVIGSGEKPLLLFHGFGQGKEVFYDLADALSKEYTVYSFDLFFHGKSEWNQGEEPLEKEFWKELMMAFFSQHQIKSFSILGYSLGGKFALATLEAFPLQTKEIFLLAGDGVTTNGWYTLATYPYTVRMLFRSMILKPQRFQAITSFCFKLGLIDKGIIRFAESQMDTEEKRKRVYYSWVVFRHLKFSMFKICNLINTHGIHTNVIIGKFDKLVKAKHMKPLISRLDKCQFEVLETGHNGLIAKWLTARNSSN